ncbi:MAG TPA: hypothetical protein ENG30_00410 [Thermofilaceae archaeon]|nr:hypothetical protein [Thermofilaceae archaeon]
MGLASRTASLVLDALRRATHRVYQLYLKPVELLNEVREAPDAAPPIILVSATFAIHTLVACSLLKGVYMRDPSSGETVELLYNLYANFPTFVLLRAASLVSIWFMLFIAYWFMMYLLGSRVEGFTVFSATGYMLSCQILTFTVILAVYSLAAFWTPPVILVAIRGAYPHLSSLAAFRYRLELISSQLNIPVEVLIEGFEYFGSAWSFLFTILMFRIVGDLTWKKALGGGAAASGAAWLIASIFRVAGLM